MEAEEDISVAGNISDHVIPGPEDNLSDSANLVSDSEDLIFDIIPNPEDSELDNITDC